MQQGMRVRNHPPCCCNIWFTYADWKSMGSLHWKALQNVSWAVGEVFATRTLHLDLSSAPDLELKSRHNVTHMPLSKCMLHLLLRSIKPLVHPFWPTFTS